MEGASFRALSRQRELIPLVADIHSESGIAAHYLTYDYLKLRNFRLAENMLI